MSEELAAMITALETGVRSQPEAQESANQTTNVVPVAQITLQEPAILTVKEHV